MKTEQVWATLTARALQYDRVPGGFQRFTQADAAALLAGLSRRPFLTAMLCDVGDDTVHGELYRRLRDFVIERSVTEAWKFSRPLMFQQLALLAIFELVGARDPCMVCDGRGSVPIEEGSPTHIGCEICRGTGKAPLTGRDRAALIGIHESTWSKVWRDRYEIVFGELHNWLADARHHVRRRLRKERRATA